MRSSLIDGVTTVHKVDRAGRRVFLRRALASTLTPLLAGVTGPPLPDGPPIAAWMWGDPIFSPPRIDRYRGPALGTLFVYVSPPAAVALLEGDELALRAIRLIGGANRRLFAAAGEPEWARGADKLPEQVHRLVDLCRRTNLFSGIHLDIEPNALPEWHDQRDRKWLIAGTEKFYSDLRSYAPSVHIDMAANPIFSIVSSGDRSFMHDLAVWVDSVSLMAYRASVSRALAWAGPAIRDICLAGRSWRMGVLLEEDRAEPGASWFGSSDTFFIEALRQLDQSLGSSPWRKFYAGIVVQDYSALADRFS